MRHRWTLLGGLLAVLIVGPPVHADDRALLIGIGQGYPPRARLDGPGRDVELAQILAQRMGFTNIKVLRDEDATRRNMMAGLSWLEDGVGRNEQAFVYYSGHGTQLADNDSDEQDGCDEALVPVSAEEVNFIRDEEFGQPLRNLAAKGAQVLAVVDSCFSGTITKGFGQRPHGKYLAKTGASCGQAVNVKAFDVLEETDASVSRGLVVLTAAADNEVALADVTGQGKGSLFTQAMYDVVDQSGRESPTFQDLRNRIESHIRQVAEENGYASNVHTPQLEGDSSLFSNRLPIAAFEEPDTPRELFEQLIRRSDFAVTFHTAKDKVRLDEYNTFTVQTSEAGYLNLVEFEPNGDMHLLFPNGYRSENDIQAGTSLRIPDDIGGFTLRAREPLGLSRVYALVSSVPLNLYENDIGQNVGKFKVFLFGQALKAVRSFAVDSAGPTDDAEPFGAAVLTVEVVE